MDDLRTFPKRERHRLVVSLIARKRIGTQHELMSSLASAGCRVTQATVSRDIAELGLEKVHDALGRPRYVQPQDVDSNAPREALAAVLSQFGRRATAAENIVVVVAELGAAPAIARALDRVRDERVVGTLAGDDTCLVIAPSSASAKLLAHDLSDLIG